MSINVYIMLLTIIVKLLRKLVKYKSKPNLFVQIFLLLLVINPSKTLSQKRIFYNYVVIQNSTGLDRTNEVIAIRRNQFKNIPFGYFPQVSKGKKICISQLTDNDLDGKWDDLLVEVSMKPNSKGTLSVRWVKEDQHAKFENATNVRFSLKTKTENPEKEINFLVRKRGFTQNIADPVYQMEGPGIENDKVAFRTFFDIRNSEDIYGKITSKPILEKVGVGASWHILQDWGMDIFKTGNSLGAGGLAIEEKNQVFRLADADTTIFQVLYKGPLKAAFCLSYKNWDIGTGHGDGSEIISMTKGNYYYQNDITVGLNPNQYLIAGIANFNPDSLIYQKHNTKISSVSVYGAQAEGTLTKLGVAIIFPTNEYSSSSTKSTYAAIPNNSYVKLKNLPAGKKTIYFAACWEKTDQRFSTQAGFENYLKQTAQLLANPVQVHVINIK